MDRPILFSGPMVQALREGRKTQTRRVLRTWSGRPFENLVEDDPDHYSGEHNDPDSWGYPYADDGANLHLPEVAMSQYHVGDRLWVREAWRCNGWASDLATIFYRASEGEGYTAMCEQYPVAGKAPARVTATWRPGIHMPRWASRLTLPVVDVRVQRLQDISEEDAIAEGCGQYASSTALHRDRPFTSGAIGSYREGFSELWEGLNGPRGYGWDVNPWVVAVTFAVVAMNVDDVPEVPLDKLPRLR